MNSSLSSQQVPTGTETTQSAVTSSDSTIQNTASSSPLASSQSSASSSSSSPPPPPPPPPSTSMSATPSPSPSESTPAPSSSGSSDGAPSSSGASSSTSSSSSSSSSPSSTPSSSSSSTTSTPPPSSSPSSSPPPPTSPPTTSSSPSPSPPPSSIASSESPPSTTPSITQPSSTSSSIDSSSSPSSSSNGPPLTSPQPSQSGSASVTIVTSLITSTVGGQLKTITTTFPSSVSLNTPPPSSASSSRNTGVIVGSAIGGTVVALLLLSGIFLLYRRGFRRKAAFSLLPTAPRSPPLHEQDFDLEGPSQPQPTLPSLLPVRGSESGSIFREEVWPPPNSGSRLQDPLLAASRIDLSSVVDAVMGPSHPRWSSADTASSEPLLGRDTPDGHSVRPSTSGSNQMGVGAQNPIGATTPGVGPSQQPPVMNTGPPHQPAMGVGSSAGQTAVHPAAANHSAGVLQPSPTTFGNPSNAPPLPPGAAPPFTPFLNRPINRQRRSGSIQSSGSPPPTDMRAERSAFGPLMVINSSPDGDQDMPLVDLSSNRNEMGSSNNNIPNDNPPLYHTLPDLTTEPLQPTRKGEGSSSPPAAQ